MSAHANPDIVDDSLVFIYDTDDGKSFKGEPTVNLATDSPSQGGWAGGREVLDSSRKKFKLIVNNFNASAGSGQGWRSFTWDLNSYSGQSVTISATVEVPSASPGTFAWVMMGQTNTHTSNNSGAGQYMGYSAASERVVKTTTTTEHITWTGTVGSTGTASQPSGHVGFTLWYNGGTIGVDSYVEVSNVQIEINSHATQFVNGTRSATQGLLDRTGNTTINISNASFDSSAEMTFDGTDDIINTGLFSGRNPSTDPFTVEAVVRSDVTSGSKIWIDATSNGSSQRFYSALIDSTSHAIGIQGSAWSDPVPSDTNWHHQVIVMDGSTAKAYNNGELASSKSYTSYTLAGGLNIGGRSGYPWSGQIPIFKIYDRALTQDEVSRNYNAIKSRFGL